MCLTRLTRGFALILAISGALFLPFATPLLGLGWLNWLGWIAIGLGVRWLDNPFFWFYSLVWNACWLVLIFGANWPGMDFRSQHLFAHLTASVAFSATALVLQVWTYVRTRRRGCENSLGV
jgi:hypothetical protein